MSRITSVSILLFVGLSCGKSGQSNKPETAKTRANERVKRSNEKTKPGATVRQQVIVLTPAAAAQVSRLLSLKGARFLRVAVDANYSYQLKLEERMDPKRDIQTQSQGVSIVIDRQSAQLIPVGLVIGFHNAIGRKGFTFNAPKTHDRPPDTSKSLAEARRGFHTKLVRRESANIAAPDPPNNIFRKVWYEASPGMLVAYITPDPKDGKRRPAIIWITGGDCNTIGDGCWRAQPPTNDQSAKAYRQAGIVMMFPSQRGGNKNPGYKEGFLGEVEDIVSAAEYLSRLPYVDAKRIYLGGHSSGGTLALLTAEYSDRFRAVFSFGPTDDVVAYPPSLRPFSLSDPNEGRLRAPILWLHSIKNPTFVFEGSEGAIEALQSMAKASKNSKVRFLAIQGANHFNILAPVNRLISRKMLADKDDSSRIQISQKEVDALFATP